MRSSPPSANNRMNRTPARGSLLYALALVLALVLCFLSSCEAVSNESSGSTVSTVSAESSEESAAESSEESLPGETSSGDPVPSEETSEGPSEDPAQNSSEEPVPSEEPHVHEFVKEVVPPTCLNPGKIIERCECGKTREKEGDPALGHDWKTETKEATCEEGGRTVRTCSRCGATESEDLPALGHKLVNVSYSLGEKDGGYDYSERGDCERCGKKDVVSCSFRVDGAVAFDPSEPQPDVPNEGGKVTAVRESAGSVRIKAVPNDYYDFLGWSDGSKKQERVYEGPDSVTAYFGFKTNVMPVLQIHTEDSQMILSRDSYLRCTVSLSGCETEFAMTDVEGGIRVRGNASSNYGDPEYPKTHKVHYRLKFDMKQAMLGLNGGAKCKSWVLLRGDQTFLRETLAFKMFTDISEGKYYSSDYTFVQLYVNGEYYGAYVLCEQTQIQKNRISITELKEGETELRTGYLIEIDNYASKEPYKFYSNFGSKKLTDMYGVEKTTATHGYSIKYDQMTDAQFQFVRRCVNNTYEIIYQAVYKNAFYTLDEKNNLIKDTESKTAKECISRVFDLDAAVAMYITREIAAERDGGCGSFFMYVDFASEQPRLTFCAPWDFSWAYSTSDGFAVDHFWVSAFQPPEFAYAGDRSFTWFITLYKAEFFQEMVKEKWRDMTARGVQKGILKEIDRICATYKEEFKLNNQRWKSGDQAAGARKIYNFLKERMDWLDTQWGS